MRKGVLDLLTVIPQNEIVEIGIPFVRSLIEKKLDKRQIEMWDEFWEYFISYWVMVVGAYQLRSHMHINSQHLRTSSHQNRSKRASFRRVLAGFGGSAREKAPGASLVVTFY